MKQSFAFLFSPSCFWLQKNRSYNTEAHNQRYFQTVSYFLNLRNYKTKKHIRTDMEARVELKPVLSTADKDR